MNTRETLGLEKLTYLNVVTDWLIDQNCRAYIRQSASPMTSPFDKLPLLKPIPLSK